MKNLRNMVVALALIVMIPALGVSANGATLMSEPEGGFDLGSVMVQSEFPKHGTVEVFYTPPDYNGDGVFDGDGAVVVCVNEPDVTLLDESYPANAGMFIPQDPELPEGRSSVSEIACDVPIASTFYGQPIAATYVEGRQIVCPDGFVPNFLAKSDCHYLP